MKTTEPEPEPTTYLLTTTQFGDFEHSSKYGVLLSASLFSEKKMFEFDEFRVFSKHKV